MKVILKNLRIAPKKLNLIAEMVRGKNVTEALSILKFTPKRAAPFIYKGLFSALKNAENLGNHKEQDLVIEKIYVGKGMTLKRFMPVSRGRAHAIRKRCSNLKIFLKSTIAASESKTTKVKEPVKVEETATEKPVKKTTARKKAATKSPKN